MINGCENEIKNAACRERHIRQGYLSFSKGMSLRIRDTNFKNYELTYKQKVGKRVIEIETDIEKKDFEDLWEISVNRLEKIRYDIKIKKNLWEVDAFKDHNHETYILVAEHEMPEGMLKPKKIPEIILKSLLYSVDRNDDRFASKKLADVKYSKKLYNKILEEIKNEK